MKIAGLEPIFRVTTGPYFLWRFLRMDSSSEKVFRISRKFPMMGMVGGPGGRFWESFLEKGLKTKRAMSTEMGREMRMRNHVSMVEK